MGLKSEQHILRDFINRVLAPGGGMFRPKREKSLIIFTRHRTLFGKSSKRRIEGNEMVDKLAKAAAQDVNEQDTVYDTIPTTTVATEIKMEGLRKWQTQWDSTEKGALCKTFFPLVEERLKINIPVTPEFTAIVTGHGKTKLYLHRFKLIDNPTCPCNEEAQSTEHIIHKYKILQQERSYLKQRIKACGGHWAPDNSKLVSKYLNAFSQFIKTTDFNKMH